MFDRIPTEHCKFLTEEIMCAQNFNFAFEFFQNADLQAHFGQTFSEKKIFGQFFDKWKFLWATGPTICLLATMSLRVNWIKSKFFPMESDQTCCQYTHWSAKAKRLHVAKLTMTPMTIVSMQPTAVYQRNDSLNSGLSASLQTQIMVKVLIHTVQQHVHTIITNNTLYFSIWWKATKLLKHLPRMELPPGGHKFILTQVLMLLLSPSGKESWIVIQNPVTKKPGLSPKST